LVFTIGKGQDRPRAFSSLSKFIVHLPRVIIKIPKKCVSAQNLSRIIGIIAAFESIATTGAHDTPLVLSAKTWLLASVADWRRYILQKPMITL
jgi:hypothetical protein